jgi:hypothetical protein
MEMERVEESVPLHRQAAEIHVRLNAPAGEGNARHNLAFALSTLGRHDEARREAERALVCKKPLGHGSSPWLTWQLLEMIERGAGRPEAAREARRSAVVSYVAYRRDGGVSASPVASLYDRVARAAAGNDPGETEALLARLAADPAVPGYLAVALPALRAILAGARDPGLADDPALDYDDAAELRLILERLAPPPA